MELIETAASAALSEDRRIFDELVQRYHKQAYNIAYRMTGNHADAEDLTQEAFIRAFRFFAQYKRELPFDSWLYKIMSNVFVDMLRRRPKAQIRSLDQPIATEDGEAVIEIADDSAGPEEQLMSREMDSRIQAALNSIPEDFRLAVIYADIEGLSYEEIADAMNCSIGTVRSRLHRGRKLLRDRLKYYTAQMQ
ncbi:MAG TPA: sigma-70 family RNA polymerase sigma factor [Armatimonadota bacterium]|nr:sigma-70 family RNA polymerase sigma factor [Armatimonadota bacterium]HOM73172.1 sigma-70 family RNA polymerase sigma factor [Armatimonadota bacterium]